MILQAANYSSVIQLWHVSKIKPYTPYYTRNQPEESQILSKLDYGNVFLHGTTSHKQKKKECRKYQMQFVALLCKNKEQNWISWK